MLLLMFAPGPPWHLFLLVCQLSAQSYSVPYDSPGGPTLHITSPSYAYPSNYQSIRQVDFRNLTLNIFFEKANRLRYRLKNGRCETDDHPGQTSVELRSIHNLSSEKGGRQHALVLYFIDSVGGSSSQDGVAQVFELSDEHLRVTQQIEWDLRFGGPWGPFDTFDEKTMTFLVRTAHYLPGDAHCCLSAIDVVRLSWNGRRFVQTEMRTELSDCGRREGKKLEP
jgi:hypothetical protein